MQNPPPNAATLLLNAEGKKVGLDPGKLRAHPVVFAAGNLFFCGYMEHLLKADPGGHAMALFLFIEASICFLFSIGYHFQSIRELLVKSSVFPARGRDRFLFNVACVLRKPLTLALWITAGLFVIVFCRQSPGAAILGLVFFSAMLLDMILLGSILSLASIRTPQAAGALFFGIALAIPILLAASMVFHAGGVLGVLPVVSWTGEGIRAAQAGSATGVADNLGFLLALMIGGIILGNKIA
jgi:hypothetical protein